MYTANNSVGDSSDGDKWSKAPRCIDVGANGKINVTTPDGWITTAGGRMDLGWPGLGCPVGRWVTNLSTDDNKVIPTKWDKVNKKVIPSSGGIQACTNVCDKDFDKLNICVPIDWKGDKPTECKKVLPNITVGSYSSGGTVFPKLTNSPPGCTFDDAKVTNKTPKCTGTSWCGDGYRPGTGLHNNFVVPMTNPYHNSEFCVNARKPKQPSTNPPSGKKSSGMSKGAIIGIITGSVALIGGVVAAILLSKKKTLLYKSVSR